MSLKFGFQGKLYRNTGTWGVPVWSEVKHIGDVNANVESEEADASIRGMGGWKATEPSLHDVELEVNFRYDPEDADFDVFRDAWKNRTALDLAVMDGDIATTGSQGPRAEFKVMKFPRSEQLSEAMGIQMTLKPCLSSNTPLWHEVP